MIAKPKKTENDGNCSILSGFSETKICSEPSVEKDGKEINEGTDKEYETKDNVILSALPPPEMFEIRNSPPLPSAGSKKIKKLMERNKK